MIAASLTYFKKFEKNLWLLAFGWFVSALGFAVSIPFIAIYFHTDLGLSLSQIGFFFGGLAIVRSLFQLVGGEVSDRVERRYLLIYSQVARAIAFGALAVSIYNNWGLMAIAACLVVQSIFGAIFQPVANAMVADILTSEKRLDGYAITRSAGNLGWAVGPALGGFMAVASYSFLFVISSVVTLGSALVFWLMLKSPKTEAPQERFKMKDLIAIREDPNLAIHSMLIFVLYLVVAQLIAPFSVYAVDMVGISHAELGYIYAVNGLLVVSVQIPITKLLSRFSLTTQLAWGGVIYAVGYGLVGIFSDFNFLMLAIVVVTFGEMFMSPPSLALTSRLAPKERMGRYMGIFGFFVASGWSFGPLYGGLILDHFGSNPAVAWVLISTLALISSVGYLLFKRKLPRELDFRSD